MITDITGPNLDLLCVWQSDAIPFCKNYAKLYFDANSWDWIQNKRDWIEGGEIFGALFSKKLPNQTLP